MKRSRAFVLTELLTGMALQASFLLVLCMSFYMMLSFYTRTQQALTARDRGQRVIAFFDNRIRHAGLGMWKCNNSQDVINALWSLTSSDKDYKKSLNKLVLPVAITSIDMQLVERSGSSGYDFEKILLKEGKTTIITNSLDHPAYCGDVLTLLYAERDTTALEHDTATAHRMNLVFVKGTYQAVELGNNVKSEVFKLIDPSISIKYSNFKNDKVLFRNNPYAVSRATGVPFQLENMGTIYDYTFNIALTGINIKSVDVLPTDELLYLKCTRMFVHLGGVDNQRNFQYKNFTSAWDKDKVPHEQGVLEIYMELDTVTKIFDLYVLSTGGEDTSTTRSRPEKWPQRARWKDKYSGYSLYVSHASWKLHNLENFTF